mgnify:CR=1 FL=1
MGDIMEKRQITFSPPDITEVLNAKNSKKKLHSL